MKRRDHEVSFHMALLRDGARGVAVGRLNSTAECKGRHLYLVGGVAARDGDFRGEEQSEFLLRDRLGALSVRSLDLLDRLWVKRKQNQRQIAEKRPL